MYSPVVTKDATAVEAEAQNAFLTMFPEGDELFVSRVFGWASDCFTGRFADYQPIDARYHDFEHTLQGTLCFVRLLQGRFQAKASPVITERMFQLGLIAILLHDTGYLKRRGDTEGTGAKYTITHVDRSADFAGQLLTEKEGFSGQEIKAVQRMICCTGINNALSQIPFQDEQEKEVGFALGTADLLGQMAADDYIDKLPMLYSEFAEAAAYQPNRPSLASTFSSARDLMKKTPDFWEKYVQKKLKGDFGAVYRFLNVPFPDGPNYYWERIEANIERLKRMLAQDTIANPALP